MPVEPSPAPFADNKLPYRPMIPLIEAMVAPVSGMSGMNALRSPGLVLPMAYRGVEGRASSVGTPGFVAPGGADPYTMPPALAEAFTPTPRRQPPDPISIGASYSRSRELPYEMRSAASWYDEQPRSQFSNKPYLTAGRDVPASAGPARTQFSHSPRAPVFDDRRSMADSQYDSDDSYYSAPRRSRRGSHAIDGRALYAPSSNGRARQHHRRGSLPVDDLANDFAMLNAAPSDRQPSTEFDDVYRRSAQARLTPSSYSRPRSSREDLSYPTSPQLAAAYASEDERPLHPRHRHVRNEISQRHRRVSSLSSNGYWSSDDDRKSSKPRMTRRVSQDSPVHLAPPRHDARGRGTHDHHPPPPKQQSQSLRRHHSLSHKHGRHTHHHRDDEYEYAPAESIATASRLPPVPRRRRALSHAGQLVVPAFNDMDDNVSVAGSALTFEDGPLTAGGRMSDYGLPLHARAPPKPDWRRYCVQRGTADVYL